MSLSILLSSLPVYSSLAGMFIGSIVFIKNRSEQSGKLLGLFAIVISMGLMISASTHLANAHIILRWCAILIPLLSIIYFEVLYAKEEMKPLKKTLLIILVSIIGGCLLDIFFRYTVKEVLFAGFFLGIFSMFKSYHLFSSWKRRRVGDSDVYSFWWIILQSILGLYYLLVSISVIQGNDGVALMLLQIATSSLILCLTSSLILLPKIMFGDTITIREVQPPPVEEIKKVSHELTTALHEEYLEKIQSYIEEQKPFLEQKLTLNKLSQELDLSPSYTSKVINKQFGKSFRDYINSFRVQYAAQLLQSAEMKNFTIEAIAQESGFHSRTAFYNAFKKNMAVSPGEFMDRFN